MIELLLVCAFLVGVLALMVPRLRRGRGASSLAGLRRYRSPDDLGGYLGGMLAALAVASFCTAVGTLTATSVTIGALMGIAWVIVRPFAFLRGVLAGSTGVLGIVGTVLGFFSDAQCGDVALSARLASLAVLAVAAAIGAAIAGVTGQLRPSGALAGFAALEVLVFLSTPLGVSVLDTSGLGVVASIVISALFGFFSFLAPRVVMGLGAVAVGLTSVGGAATVGVACGTQQWDAVIAILGFTILYALCSAASRLVRR